MKIPISVIIVSLLSTAYADSANGLISTVEDARIARIARTGGQVEQPNSARGKIVFVNTQEEMPTNNISAAIKSLKDVLTRYSVQVVSSKLDEARKLKNRYNADIAIIIVSKEDAPSLLVAPEENWAIINVHSLQKNLKSDAAQEKFFEARCRKEIMRGFACAAGGLDSTFPGNIMSITKIEDLDFCEEFLPFDKVNALKSRMKAIGVTPARSTSYRVACREGWASAPTNDVQQAIWDKVKAEQNAKPTKPIRILPGQKPSGR